MPILISLGLAILAIVLDVGAAPYLHSFVVGPYSIYGLPVEPYSFVVPLPVFTPAMVMLTAVWAGVDASRLRMKERGYAGGGLITLLVLYLWCVGFPVYLYRRRNVKRLLESEAAAAAVEAATKKCPFCGEQIKREAIVCRFCRSNLGSPTNAVSTSSVETRKPETAPASLPEATTVEPLTRGTIEALKEQPRRAISYESGVQPNRRGLVALLVVLVIAMIAVTGWIGFEHQPQVPDTGGISTSAVPRPGAASEGLVRKRSAQPTTAPTPAPSPTPDANSLAKFSGDWSGRSTASMAIIGKVTVALDDDPRLIFHGDSDKDRGGVLNVIPVEFSGDSLLLQVREPRAIPEAGGNHDPEPVYWFVIEHRAPRAADYETAGAYLEMAAFLTADRPSLLPTVAQTCPIHSQETSRCWAFDFFR